MGTFVPNIPAEQQEMLHAAGYRDFDDLFGGIPEEVRLKDGLSMPEGLSEMEASRHVSALAGENRVYSAIFRGAGAYDHYIPSIVGRIVRKEKFLTAYTPYQAEISQGVLQSIFEYQSMICQLTGMDVANASVYDGATAAAEGAMMCLDKKRSRILVSATVSPAVRDVVKTYCFGRGVPYAEIPEEDGVTSEKALREMLTKDTAGVLIMSPNFCGNIEPAEELGKAIHEAGAKFVLSCDPISLGILRTPAELGADVAVGEGQSLGMPLSFGGPYLGFMAATAAMMRHLPGRIVGETVDHDGNRAYVLTLQAREQHIKREKAGSNICSNEALCALTAAVYLAAVGKRGLEEIAKRCISNAHYLAGKLAEAGWGRCFEKQEFFEEFVTAAPGENGEEAEAQTQALLEALDQEGILGGLPLGNGRILWCATEKNTKADMDRVAELAKEVRA